MAAAAEITRQPSLGEQISSSLKRGLSAVGLAAAPVPWDDRWHGHWAQASIESSVLEATLKSRGVPWVLRKAILSMKAEYKIEPTESGGIRMTEKPPTPGGAWLEYKIAEGATHSFGVFGISIANTVTFADGKLTFQNVETSKDGATATTTLIFTYDADADTLVITTVQKEGTFDKVLKRKGK